jgi:hypothetical protein
MKARYFILCLVLLAAYAWLNHSYSPRTVEIMGDGVDSKGPAAALPPNNHPPPGYNWLSGGSGTTLTHRIEAPDGTVLWERGRK